MIQLDDFLDTYHIPTRIREEIEQQAEGLDRITLYVVSDFDAETVYIVAKKPQNPIEQVSELIKSRIRNYYDRPTE